MRAQAQCFKRTKCYILTFHEKPHALFSSKEMTRHEVMSGHAREDTCIDPNSILQQYIRNC